MKPAMMKISRNAAVAVADAVAAIAVAASPMMPKMVTTEKAEAADAEMMTEAAPKNHYEVSRSNDDRDRRCWKKQRMMHQKR